MSTTAVFAIFAVIFFIVMLGAGYMTKSWATSADDFNLAGREVGTTVGITAVLAISFAGSNLTLIPSFSITYGFWGAGAWCLLFSIGFAVYALLPGKYLRRCGAQTLPEWLEMRYGGAVRIVVSIGGIVGLCGIMANNIASFSSLLAAFTGIPGWVSTALCFLVMIAFTVMSGQWAVKVTSFIQVIIGVIAIPLAAFLLGRLFGWDFSAGWPNAAGWLGAGIGGQSLPVFSLKYPSVLTFAVLNAFFLVWGSNYFFLTAACMRSEKVMKRSYLAASVLQIPFVYLPLILIGIMAGAVNADLFAPLGSVAPTAAYSVMLLNLGAAVSCFAMVGGMCASISTASTALVASQATATRDIYLRKLKPEATPGQALTAGRIIVVLLGVVCLLLTFYPGGPTYLFAFSNAWMGPPAILLLLGMCWPRITDRGALCGVLSGMGAMAVFTLLDLTGIYSIGAIMHVGVLGLILTLAVTILASLATEPRYFGKPQWRADPARGAREAVELREEDLALLGLIRDGLDQMVELADYRSGDVSGINLCVERLDRGGYIKRQSLRGAGFYAFSVTRRGLEALGREALPPDGLSAQARRLLTAIEGGGLELFAREQGVSGAAVSALISMLDRRGYVRQYGFLRRRIALCAAGREALKSDLEDRA